MTSIKETPKTQRLFFALWPEATFQKDILKAVKKPLKRGGGRFVAVENLHITLAFLGSVDATVRQCVEQVADSIAAKPFTLGLSRLGYWSRPRVIWIAPEGVPEELTYLCHTLRQALAPCAHEPDPRPYAPHMTLMRKAQHEPATPIIPPLAWDIHRFALVESQTLPTGACYRVLRDWPLQG